MSPAEEVVLHQKVSQAWDLKERGSPYYHDSLVDLVDWHYRRKADEAYRKLYQPSPRDYFLEAVDRLFEGQRRRVICRASFLL